jgi:hypothetical protein
MYYNDDSILIHSIECPSQYMEHSMRPSAEQAVKQFKSAPPTISGVR